MTLLAGTVSAYSQGAISMDDYGIGFCIQVLAPQSSGNNATVSYGGYSGNETMGDSGNSYCTSPGSATYQAGSAAGNGYDVQLLIAAGSGDAVSSLGTTGTTGDSPITTWYTAAGGNPVVNGAGGNGIWNTVANVLFGSPGEAVTVAIAAWNNEGGTVNSLAAAQEAGDPWGVSNGADQIMGDLSGLASLPSAIESFSLAADVVPEPGTIALGVIGASAFLFRRRK